MTAGMIQMNIFAARFFEGKPELPSSDKLVSMMDRRHKALQRYTIHISPYSSARQKFANTQIHKYTNPQIHTCTNINELEIHTLLFKQTHLRF